MESDQTGRPKIDLEKHTRDPKFLRSLWQNLRLLWRLVRDPEVPITLKAIPLAAVLYLLLPVDLVPDFIVGLGQIDDLVIVSLAARAFLGIVPEHIVERHRLALRKEGGALPNDDSELQESIVINQKKQ